MSKSRKKEYIVVFYDIESDKEVGKTKATDLMTENQANEYIKWAYMYGLFKGAYGMPIKISDYKGGKL